MSDTAEVGSPEWLRDTLLKELTDRNKATEIYNRYYEGEHRLQFASSKFRESFGALFDDFSDNWCELVVDAVEERMNVEGFRFTGDPKGDQEAWDIWQRNQLDAFSQQAHLESLIYGNASALVWQVDGVAEITIESPTQMIVAIDAGNRRRRIAALKVWDDESGDTLATLYTATEIFKWSRKSSASGKGNWTEREGGGAHKLAVVPVIPLPNRPRLLRPGKSEIANVLTMQDAVNKELIDMLVASEYQAFRQRWATGMEFPDLFDDKGKKLPVDEIQRIHWQHAVDRLWTTEDTETKFGEFAATDLAPFVTAIEMLVQHVASQTRTPPHYFYLSGTFPSGESIKAAETGLVAKVLRKERFYGEGWEDVIRLAFKIEDDARWKDYKAETIWADAESRTESEHVDAVIKKAAVGIPLRQLWVDLGYSPQQIERFAALRAQEAAEQADLAAGLAQALDGAATAPAGAAEQAEAADV
jgi:hypothetical protein